MTSSPSPRSATATDGTEIFVHQTDIEMDGFRTLTAGQPVSFTTIVGAGGKAKAAAVVPLAAQRPAARSVPHSEQDVGEHSDAAGTMMAHSATQASQSNDPQAPSSAAACDPRHLLDLPSELLQRVAEVMAAREYGAFSRACTGSRTAAAGALSVVVGAEVAQRLKTGLQISNSICRACPALVVPVGVTSVGDRALIRCHSLTSIVLPEGLMSVGAFAFQLCALTSVVLPASCTSIGEYAFNYCRSLASITLPASLTKIGVNCFNESESLTTITIPDKVSTIQQCTFAACTALTSISLPASLTLISSHAFCECTSLTAITIPDKVDTIGAYTFRACRALTSITFPANLTKLGSGAFFSCTALTSITLPPNITSIGMRTFHRCTALQSITIPDSVTYINPDAFPGCSALDPPSRARILAIEPRVDFED